MNIKPIFLVGIPNAPNDMLNDVAKTLSKRMPDYYTFIYPVNGEDFKFQVFYEKDFNKVKYEQLKQMVKDSIKTEKI